MTPQQMIPAKRASIHHPTRGLDNSATCLSTTTGAVKAMQRVHTRVKAIRATSKNRSIDLAVGKTRASAALRSYEVTLNGPAMVARQNSNALGCRLLSGVRCRAEVDGLKNSVELQ